MSGRKKGILLAVVGAGLWGVLGVPVRILTRHGLGAVELSFIRCLAAGLFYWAFAVVTAPGKIQHSPSALAAGGLYGLLVYGGAFTAYNYSIAHIPVAVSTTLMFLCPIWVLIGSWCLWGHKAGVFQLLTMLACLLGTALVSGFFSAKTMNLSALGVLAGIFNGIGVALRILLPKCLAGKYSGETLQVYGFLGSALFLGILSDKAGMLAAFSGGGLGEMLAALALACLVCTLAANVMFVQSGCYISSVESSILSSTEVVVGSLMGLLVYGERLAPSQVCGMALVVGGAIASQLGRHRDGGA